jgi:hypothetical protein
MAYTIKNSDGTTLLILADGKVDEQNTSLSLIGKNVPNYGEYFNNNLIGLLENFSSVDEPRSPLVGQLWFDLGQGRLKIYTADQIFRPVIGALISDRLPTEVGTGDFWWDIVNKQMKFFPQGYSSSPEIIGPATAAKYGKTGWIAETLTDINGTDYYVTSLYSNDMLIGVMSDRNINLLTAKEGLSTLVPGINLNPFVSDLTDIRFVGTATSADSVQGIPIAKLIRNDINQATTGSFSIVNNLGLNVGTNQDISILVDTANSTGIIQSSVPNQDLKLRVTDNTIGLVTALYFSAGQNRLGVWNESPAYPLDVLGDTRIQGNLTVVGTTTYITSANLAITDKNIELAAGQNTPLDSVAAGGGITLHGANDYQIKWASDGSGWNINDNLNLKSDQRTYTGLIPTSTTGTTATFTVSSIDAQYSVVKTSAGSAYSIATTASATLKILGTSVGGATPDNDVTITILSVTPSGGVDTFSFSGTAPTGVFKINSSTVLTQTSLGVGVTDAPGLVRFGHVDYLNVGNLWLSNNTLTTTGTDQTLYLNATGTGSIDVNNNKITSIATPVIGTDAATKQYVDDKLQQRYNASIVLNMDVTNFSAPVENGIITYLNALMPIRNTNSDPLYQIGDEIFDLSTGTRVRVLCSSISVVNPTTVLNLNKATTTVDKGGVQNAQSVVTDVAGTSTYSLLIPTVTYVTKQFRIDSSLSWIYEGDVA